MASRLPAHLTERFQNDVLNLMATWASTSGELAISFLQQMLRQECGWRNLGSNLADFEAILTDAGFSFRREYKEHKSGWRTLLRTYVTL